MNTSSQRTVLVVEDEPSISDTITYALLTEGFRALSCTTGGQALELIKANSISLVILDVGLPDSNGFELCKKIQQIVNVPIIFLTARANEVDRVVGLEIGADDYITKPFSPRELTARVKAVLRRTYDNQTSKNRGSDVASSSLPFRVDKDRHIIYYNEIALELSRYEYRLLQVLIERPGWVFSREKLMDLVWEEPEMSLDRTVDTHIKNIRTKLRAVRSDIDPITTHRGEGYSLKE